MSLGLVLINNASLELLGLVLIGKRKKDKSETATSLSELLAHDDCVLNFAKVLEVILKVLLRS